MASLSMLEAEFFLDFCVLFGGELDAMAVLPFSIERKDVDMGMGDVGTHDLD